MDINRKHWNERHQKLARLLSHGDRDPAIELFLEQHAMVHSGKVSKSELWSFEDELLGNMTEEEVRQIPAGGEHSIVWILLHLARIEDIVLNMLIAGTEQVFTEGSWAKKMNISVLHSANKMDDASVAELSASTDIQCLLEYRRAVARRTRQIVKKLQASDFRKRVDPFRIEKVFNEGAVTHEAIEIVHYWSRKTIASLLLMPPTRHCILHLNEAMRIKAKIQKGK
jgi:hypothetical protein